MTSPGRIAFNDCDLCQIVFHAVCPNLTAIMQCLITKARKKGECTLQPCFAQLLEIRTWSQNWHSVHVKIRNLQHCLDSLVQVFNRRSAAFQHICKQQRRLCGSDAFCYLVAHMTRVLAHDDQCVN